MDRPISLEARRIDLRIEPPFRLGRLRVDPPAHEYAIDGTACRMQPQTLKVLVALHDKLGQVVTRDELVDRCWDGRIVGEDVINRSISLLRRLAGEGDFEIETVPRAGYRLREVAAPDARARNYPLVAGLALAAAAAAAGTFFLVPQRQPSRSATLAVALVPFTAEHGNAAEKGVATDTDESVTRMLTESGFSVQTADPMARPQPDLLVSGQISGAGGPLTASVKVEDVRRHVVILSHRLDALPGRGADLPDEIGANLAGSLSWADELLRLDEQHPSDPAVIAQMLDQFTNEDFDFWRTYEFSRRHAPSEPNSAVAQWQLAMVTGLVMHALPVEDRPAAVAAAVAASDRAISLDPKLGDFQVPWCMLHPLVRLAECEDHLRAGLRSDPQSAWAPSFLAHLMNNVGRTSEAAMLDAASLAEDTYAPSKIAQAIIMFDAIRDDGRAQSLYQRGARLWPTTHFLLKLRLQGIAESGDFARFERLPEEVGAANLPGYYPSVLALAGAVRAHSRQKARAACPRDSTARLVATCMIAFAQIGDLDDAFALADELYPSRLGRSAAENEKLWLADPLVLDTAFLTGSGAAPMRRDPRYLALAQRLGLLDYWRTGRLPDFCTQAHEPVCAHISRA